MRTPPAILVQLCALLCGLPIVGVLAPHRVCTHLHHLFHSEQVGSKSESKNNPMSEDDEAYDSRECGHPM